MVRDNFNNSWNQYSFVRSTPTSPPIAVNPYSNEYPTELLYLVGWS